MAQSLIAESEVDLHTVAMALEGAGYTIAGVLETRLTVEMLYTTKRPVIVLVNDQASQCMLVEVAPEASNHISSFSLPHLTASWRADYLRQVAAADVELDGAVQSDDVIAIQPVQLGPAPASTRARCERSPSAQPSTRDTARYGRHLLATLNHTRIPIRAAVAHATALAMLGGFNGYILRAPWVLVLVPVAYAIGVIVKAGHGSWSAEEAPDAWSPAPFAGEA